MDAGQAQGTSGNYIQLSTTSRAITSLKAWQTSQQSADPGGTFGNFTFAGKPAVIFRSESQYNGAKPPTPGLADMYRGESTWVQGDSVIYTFQGSRGNVNPGDAQALYDALKTVLSSWKW